MAKKLGYKELLKSQRRQGMRKRRFKECDYTCSLCKDRFNFLVLHHLRYGSCVGNERKKDLAVVCSSCHKKCHYNSLGYKIPIYNLEKRYNYLLNYFNKLICKNKGIKQT